MMRAGPTGLPGSGPPVILERVHRRAGSRLLGFPSWSWGGGEEHSPQSFRFYQEGDKSAPLGFSVVTTE